MIKTTSQAKGDIERIRSQAEVRMALEQVNRFPNESSFGGSAYMTHAQANRKSSLAERAKKITAW